MNHETGRTFVWQGRIFVGQLVMLRMHCLVDAGVHAEIPPARVLARHVLWAAPLLCGSHHWLLPSALLLLLMMLLMLLLMMMLLMMLLLLLLYLGGGIDGSCGCHHAWRSLIQLLLALDATDGTVRWRGIHAAVIVVLHTWRRIWPGLLSKRIIAEAMDKGR